MNLRTDLTRVSGYQLRQERDFLQGFIDPSRAKVRLVAKIKAELKRRLDRSVGVK